MNEQQDSFKKEERQSNRWQKKEACKTAPSFVYTFPITLSKVGGGGKNMVERDHISSLNQNTTLFHKDLHCFSSQMWTHDQLVKHNHC